MCHFLALDAKIRLSLAPDGVFDHFKRLKLTPGHGQWSHWGPESSTGHVRVFLALLLEEIANERLKILTSFLFDLQTSKCERSKWGRILPGIHWACWIYPSPLIGQDSQ